MRVQHVLLSLAFASLFASCTKDDAPPIVPEKKVNNRVTVDFSNYVGSQKLVLNSGIYTNQDGDDFSVSKIIYFISNITLKNVDGSEYTHPGYYRVSEIDEKSLSIEMENIPDGTYRSVSFMIGIDNAINQSAIASGLLNSTDEMYMNADDGYIMVNMEGRSPASHQPDNKLIYHIGGTAGPTSVVKPVTLNFPQGLVVKDNFKHIRLKTDLLMMFGPDYVVDFTTLSAIYAPGDNASVLAQNYKNMISISGIGD